MSKKNIVTVDRELFDDALTYALELLNDRLGNDHPWFTYGAKDRREMKRQIDRFTAASRKLHPEVKP